MAIDHSLTYRKFSLKNIPHKLRLFRIFNELDNILSVKKKSASYLDIGCSNGYITELVSKKYRFSRVLGLDHNLDNLEIARKNYPLIEFGFIDLNSNQPAVSETFELISCFETLEHVGDLENAISNIIRMTRPEGNVLITVPIEIRAIGLFKFLVKTLIYGYQLKELPSNPTWSNYFFALLKGEISKFRSVEKRDGWGTHFGFSYREVDKVLTKNNVTFKAKNFLTTRFYSIHIKNN